MSIDGLWRNGITRRQALLSLAGMLSAFDFEPICFANMTVRNYDYMAHGSDSDHRGADEDKTTPIDVLAAIVDAAAGKAAVLVDSGFRRGSDIAKALAFGAQGVLLARPVMWGLAAYGADGVRSVVEMLHSDLARNMGALGAPNLASLTRAMIRVHRR